MRSQPAAWVPVGFIPNYDATFATHRKKSGFDSHPSSKLNIFHQCFCILLAELVALEGTMDISWSDGITRTCTLNLGGFIGDQQEADRVTCQSGVCHRCHVKYADCLETINRAPQKTTMQMRKRVLSAAGGCHLNGRAKDQPVVEWGGDGRRRAGQQAKRHDSSRKLAGGHLVRNAFWAVHGFCAYQMFMRDPMLQIDHGVIVFLFRAILWRIAETVEDQLRLPAGTAGRKLTQRLNMVLGKRSGEQGQLMKGIHDTLMHISKRARTSFDELSENIRATPKLHSYVRCTDVRHLLLLMPLLCHELFRSEIALHNAQYGECVEDPSSLIIGVCIILLKWYHLYRSLEGHDSDDFAELDRLARLFFEKHKEVFPYKNGKGDWIMGTDKVHFMIYCVSELMKWGSISNCNAEVVENTHKTWIKEQGPNTKQGASSNKTMLKNSLGKLASRELTQAMAGQQMHEYQLQCTVSIYALFDSPRSHRGWGGGRVA